MAKHTGAARAPIDGMGSKPGAASVSPLPNVKTFDYEAGVTADKKIGPRFKPEGAVARTSKMAGA